MQAAKKKDKAGEGAEAEKPKPVAFGCEAAEKNVHWLGWCRHWQIPLIILLRTCTVMLKCLWVIIWVLVHQTFGVAHNLHPGFSAWARIATGMFVRTVMERRVRSSGNACFRQPSRRVGLLQKTWIKQFPKEVLFAENNSDNWVLFVAFHDQIESACLSQILSCPCRSMFEKVLTFTGTGLRLLSCTRLYKWLPSALFLLSSGSTPFEKCPPCCHLFWKLCGVGVGGFVVARVCPTLHEFGGKAIAALKTWSLLVGNRWG